MADVDIDPFREHESKTEEPTDSFRSGYPRKINVGTRERRARNFIRRRVSKN